MSLESALSDLADKLKDQESHIVSEQDTKSVLVVPFIRDVLEFDPENARRVRREYAADFRGRKLEKVDYALFTSQGSNDDRGNPVVVIEAKKLSTHLDSTVSDQLAGYFFATDSAPIGICTNGARYLFFSDLDNLNKMDTQPFLDLDLRDLQPSSVKDLDSLVGSGFEPSRVRDIAGRIRNRQSIRSKLRGLLLEPPDDFVRLMMQHTISERSRSTRRLREFKEDIQHAMAELFQVGEVQTGTAGESHRSEQSQQATTPIAPRITGEIALSRLEVGGGSNPAPASIRFPDGNVRDLKNWRAMVIEVTEWLYRSGRLQANDGPVEYARGGIINSESVTKQGKQMFRPHQIGGQNLYIETHGGAKTLVSRCKALLQRFRVNLDQVHVLFGDA